jgi:hypothetical protein
MTAFHEAIEMKFIIYKIIIYFPPTPLKHLIPADLRFIIISALWPSETLFR